MKLEAGLEWQVRLGLTLQKWHRTSWRSLNPDLEQGYGLWTVPRPPGSSAPPWQCVVQKQEGGRAEVDSGGGGAGYRGPLRVLPPDPALPFGPLKTGCCCCCCCLVLTTGLDDWSEKEEDRKKNTLKKLYHLLCFLSECVMWSCSLNKGKRTRGRERETNRKTGSMREST